MMTCLRYGFGNTAEDPGCLDESGKGHNGAGEAYPPQGAERNPKCQGRNSSMLVGNLACLSSVYPEVLPEPTYYRI